MPNADSPYGRYDLAAFAPRYSTDLAAAWLVHLAMCERLFSVRQAYFAAMQAETVDVAGFLVGWPDVLVVLRECLPLSICRAALAAMAPVPDTRGRE